MHRGVQRHDRLCARLRAIASGEPKAGRTMTASAISLITMLAEGSVIEARWTAWPTLPARRADTRAVLTRSMTRWTSCLGIDSVGLVIVSDRIDRTCCSAFERPTVACQVAGHVVALLRDNRDKPDRLAHALLKKASLEEEACAAAGAQRPSGKALATGQA